ncbi:DUF4920 domain-containing protein [Inquilinus sp. KBS0705]|nr:DUF4920 domain-containing protein [Inquilinus sp. KBS0705]
MRRMVTLLLILCGLYSYAQRHTPLPHGMVFGNKPNNIGPVPSSKIEDFMGKKIRVSTAIIGKITKVTKEQGGWFEMDAGRGRTISAHFKNYNIHLPVAIEGRTVIIEGVADRKLTADDLQHFAGDTVTHTKQHRQKVDPKRRIIFEVRGLMVDI